MITPENLLEELFSKNILPRQMPVDVERICSYYEIPIEHRSYDDDTVGQIQFTGDRARIFINPYENNNISRRRFTIAHELGHFFLHFKHNTEGFTDTVRTMSRTTSYWDSIESEANDFAARLLMPEQFIFSIGQDVIETFRNVYNDYILEEYFISEMSRCFNVSIQAMTYRLRNLGVI